MSRYYEMTVRVRGVDPLRTTEVKEAAEAQWPFEEEDWMQLDLTESPPTSFTAQAEGSLCAGESEKEFADRLARAVWEANEGYCEVEVIAVYLEDRPYEAYTFDEDDYHQRTQAQQP